LQGRGFYRGRRGRFATTNINAGVFSQITRREGATICSLAREEMPRRTTWFLAGGKKLTLGPEEAASVGRRKAPGAQILLGQGISVLLLNEKGVFSLTKCREKKKSHQDGKGPIRRRSRNRSLASSRRKGGMPRSTEKAKKPGCDKFNLVITNSCLERLQERVDTLPGISKKEKKEVSGEGSSTGDRGGAWSRPCCRKERPAVRNSRVT